MRIHILADAETRGWRINPRQAGSLAKGPVPFL